MFMKDLISAKQAQKFYSQGRSDHHRAWDLFAGSRGVRLEDDILVTETGYENLTDFYQEYYEI